ncbi:uncharacterized protein PHACADRAFT_184827 [Phanerochaete carnosa HHB-10118-sp]|uniref:Uncharacterized protein n=1 Tax=Phanerochaete carnosa (strain HHB-10118-sp) TaxID=650164 RepID=K5V0W7_PHACS|nr:uncharacterized protein PHACADRAFT_184827 [Phanerochaete carnosa HHB-10118-sp]EKM56126.1 hypothetical protein PHACADRAFT_184827 [Phanerochaete carnosa HHB-10118-sp]
MSPSEQQDVQITQNRQVLEDQERDLNNHYRDLDFSATTYQQIVDDFPFEDELPSGRWKSDIFSSAIEAACKESEEFANSYRELDRDATVACFRAGLEEDKIRLQEEESEHDALRQTLGEEPYDPPILYASQQYKNTKALCVVGAALQSAPQVPAATQTRASATPQASTPNISTPAPGQDRGQEAPTATTHPEPGYALQLRAPRVLGPSNVDYHGLRVALQQDLQTHCPLGEQKQRSPQPKRESPAPPRLQPAQEKATRKKSLRERPARTPPAPAPDVTDAEHEVLQQWNLLMQYCGLTAEQPQSSLSPQPGTPQAANTHLDRQQAKQTQNVASPTQEPPSPSLKTQSPQVAVSGSPSGSEERQATPARPQSGASRPFPSHSPTTTIVSSDDC